jgi:hypothetical protein
MELEVRTKAKLALLCAEMDAIHHTNGLYWKEGNFQTAPAKADYNLRNERLEKIRAELDQLRSG